MTSSQRHHYTQPRQVAKTCGVGQNDADVPWRGSLSVVSAYAGVVRYARIRVYRTEGQMPL
jgi:peptide deformylase